MRRIAVNLHRLLLRILYHSPAFLWIGKPAAKAIYAWGLPGSRFLLPRNPLFLPDFYTSSNPDVRRDRNLWAHYIGFGASEGRDPHPMFATRFYLAGNREVASLGVNPLVHYFAFGALERRWPHPGFNPVYYLMQRPDVQRSGMNPLQHYWEYGRHEGTPCAPVTTRPKRARPAAEPNLQDSIAALQSTRLFSIVLTTSNLPPQFLRLTIDSLRRQTYPQWQLCIRDEASTNEEILAVLREYAALDERIVFRRPEGEYTALLSPGDELDPEALWEVAQLFDRDPSLDAIYTDQDIVDCEGKRIEVLSKPDWSPELFRGVAFVNHLLVLRSVLIREVGGFDAAFSSVQEFELMLRVSERTSNIGHVRRVLCHSRSLGGSADGPLRAAAVNAHLARCGINAIAEQHPSVPQRVVLRAFRRSQFPRVVVAVRGGAGASAACTIHSILDGSSYPNLLICVPENIEGLADRRIVVRSLNEVHAGLAPEDFVIWVERGLEAVTPDWIENLLLYCEQPDVACAAPLIVSNENVWSAGLAVGHQGVTYPMKGTPANSDDALGWLSCSHEVSAVSGECMMISASMFHDLGGNIKYYATSSFDGADIALRGLAAKKRNIVTPQAVMRRIDAPGDAQSVKLDHDLFVDRWRDTIAEPDRYYVSNDVVDSAAETAFEYSVR